VHKNRDVSGLIEDARRLALNPHPLHANAVNLGTKKPEPITLYQKIGVGRLEMFVLNPSKDAREFADFTGNFKRLMAHQTSGYSFKPGSNGYFWLYMIGFLKHYVMFKGYLWSVNSLLSNLLEFEKFQFMYV